MKLKKPELELLLERGLVFEESTVPALSGADARERESKATVAAQQRREIMKIHYLRLSREGTTRPLSAIVPALVSEISPVSPQCSDGSNSRETLGKATDLNVNIS